MDQGCVHLGPATHVRLHFYSLAALTSGAVAGMFCMGRAGNQCRVRLQTPQTDSITGTSTNTPTTVASAAPEPGPNSAMAVATASSKKLLAPMSAPGAATEC